MQIGDLGNRIRAARGYAGGMSQDDLAIQINMSLGWLKTVESGRGVKDIEALGLIDRVSTVCGIPREWFTADWSQLDPGYVPPEDEIAALRLVVEELCAKNDQLLAAGRERETRFERIESMLAEWIQVVGERLPPRAA